jgi:hypothetical protein
VNLWRREWGMESVHGNVDEELFASGSRRNYGSFGDHGENLIGFLFVVRFEELLSQCAGICTSLS